MIRLQVINKCPHNVHFPTINNDQKDDNFDTKVEKSILGSVPTFRRTMSLKDKMQSGDMFGALALTGVAFNLLPEDIRDAKNAYKQISTKIKGGKYVPTYDYTKFQHHFSFLKGSFAHAYMKNVESDKSGEIVKKIYDSDKTLYATNLGKKIRKFLGLTDGKKEISKVKTIHGESMLLSEIKAPNAFAELTGRAMKRMTVFGIGALALCEIPKLVKAMGSGDNVAEQTENTLKQTVKSGINVASIATSIAYGGAYGAKKFGPAGSLIGMGIGAVAGATLSSQIQKIID